MYESGDQRDDHRLVRQEDVVCDIRDHDNLHIRLLPPYRKLPLLPTSFLGLVGIELRRIVRDTAVQGIGIWNDHKCASLYSLKALVLEFLRSDATRLWEPSAN